MGGKVIPMPRRQLKAKVMVSEKFLSDVLSLSLGFKGALHWCEQVGTPNIEGVSHGLAQGDNEDIWYSALVRCTVNEDERRFGKQYMIDHNVLVEGIQKILQSPVFNSHKTVLMAIAEDDASEIDPGIADSIIQHGLWREVRYS